MIYLIGAIAALAIALAIAVWVWRVERRHRIELATALDRANIIIGQIDRELTEARNALVKATDAHIASTIAERQAHDADVIAERQAAKSAASIEARLQSDSPADVAAALGAALEGRR